MTAEREREARRVLYVALAACESECVEADYLSAEKASAQFATARADFDITLRAYRDAIRATLLAEVRAMEGTDGR